MTDQIREQMSALLDGELPRSEIGLLVRRMERDPALRQAFGNYVLAGELLRSPGGMTASPGFAARVSAALDQDAPLAGGVPAPEPQAPRRWLRPAAGVAVAAGAALAAVLLVRPDPDAARLVAVQAPSGVPTSVVSLPAGGSSPTPAVNQRLAGYLMAHGQYATPIGRRAAWSNALAADPGISRVTLEVAEKR
jgi:sigma-E factor negative regulatory protein RseA